MRQLTSSSIISSFYSLFWFLTSSCSQIYSFFPHVNKATPWLFYNNSELGLVQFSGEASAGYFISRVMIGVNHVEGGQHVVVFSELQTSYIVTVLCFFVGTGLTCLPPTRASQSLCNAATALWLISTLPLFETFSAHPQSSVGHFIMTSFTEHPVLTMQMSCAFCASLLCLLNSVTLSHT